MNQPFSLLLQENKTFKLLSKYNYQIKAKDILAGRILGIEKKQSLVHLGLNQGGFLPLSEVFMEPSKKLNQKIKKEMVGEFFILYCKNTKTILSTKRLHYLKLWERLKQIDFKNIMLFTFQEKRILGGKVLNFDGLSLYLPNNHLPKYYRRPLKEEKAMEVKILEIKEKKHQILVSSRFAFLQKQESVLKVGFEQWASVLYVKPFGILLNLCGIKCLLHKSEILKSTTKPFITSYKKGDKIKVKVLYINSYQGKVALSTKF